MNEEEESNTKVFNATKGFSIIDLVFYLVLLLVALYIVSRFLIWHKKANLFMCRHSTR